MTLTEPTSAPTLIKDDDLRSVLTTLRKGWPYLLLLPLLAAGATYGLVRQQPPVYQSRTSLMASPMRYANPALQGTVITASQLPTGAVAEVIHSRAVIDHMIQDLQASTLPAELKQRISSDLVKEFSANRFARIKVSSRLDYQGAGVYDITANGETPAAAQLLAGSAVEGLQVWDRDRAQEGVAQARQSLQRQLDSLNSRLTSLPAGSVERESLNAARGQLLLNLSQASVFEEGAVGSLTVLASANAPSLPVSPKPLRNAVMAFTLMLLVTAAGLLVRAALRRKVTTAADLPFNVPLLGSLPRFRRRRRSPLVSGRLRPGLYEAAGFIQLQLRSLLHQPTAPVVVFTSPRPSDGKSTAVALTAHALATAGQRVLVIDLDLRRPTQHELWQLEGRGWHPLPGAVQTSEAQRSVIEAVQQPDFASALQVADGVDLVPARASGQAAAAFLNSPETMQRIRTWAQHYDLVLVDTPPALALPDAQLIARDSDGVVLVVSSGESTPQEIERVQANFRTSRVKLLGIILNKVSKSSETDTYYAYGQD